MTMMAPHPQPLPLPQPPAPAFGDTTLTKVFVGGLAWETHKDALREHFERYGDILEAVIISDKLTGRSKGYGFVSPPFPLPFPAPSSACLLLLLFFFLHLDERGRPICETSPT
jgi:hypothetical protein